MSTPRKPKPLPVKKHGTVVVLHRSPRGTIDHSKSVYIQKEHTS